MKNWINIKKALEAKSNYEEFIIHVRKIADVAEDLSGIDIEDLCVNRQSYLTR